MFACSLAASLEGEGRASEVVALTSGTGSSLLPVSALSSGVGRSPATLLMLRRRVRQSRVVIGHGSSTLGACSVSTRGIRPFVYRVIGDPAYWYGPKLRRLRVRTFLRRADHVVVLSERAAAWLVRELDIDRARTTVIPNAVDPASFPMVTMTARATARTRLELSTDGTYAAFIGSLSDEKRPEAAVRSVAALPGVELLMAGDGPEQRALVDLARSLLPGRIHFLGSVPDTSAVLAASDVLIVPSRTEGMPGVTIEAALSGVPVVATDVGDVREVVTDATGLVVPAGDDDALANAVRAALLDRARFDPEYGRERALAMFSMEAIAARWLAVLDGLS